MEKTMKKTTIAALGLALTLGAAGAASAQSSEPRPERDRAGQVERGGRRGGPDQMLLKGITLTDSRRTRSKRFARATTARASSSARR
jgi:Spy/CpxP family protein refolding chaperone